ncbi:MAG: YaaL family protein [Clostridiales bacterium]|nr:YaaL family protein [Clostridiales bacterium]
MFRKKPDPQTQQLLKEIEKAQRDLESAYQNFENVIDPDLIDSYIYEVNAIQHRYKFLLRQAKALPSFHTNISL